MKESWQAHISSSSSSTNSSSSSGERREEGRIRKGVSLVGSERASIVSRMSRDGPTQSHQANIFFLHKPSFAGDHLLLPSSHQSPTPPIPISKKIQL